MADSKITALTAITTVNPATYPLVIVDTSDTSMAITGTTKKVTTNQLLGAGGTATLASATITGDLTVDTNTLKVDSANNRVGIGTATPAETLTVAGKIRSVSSTFGLSDVIAETTAGTGTGYARLIVKTADREWRLINDASTSGSPFIIYDATANAESLRIATAGVYTFGDGAGGTRMTLNATGLIRGASSADIISTESTTLTNIGNIGAAYGTNTGTYFAIKVGAANGIVELKADARSGAYPPIVFTTGATERLRIDSSGNVGIGVTPSAWGSGIKGLDLGAWTSVAQIGAASFYGFNSYASTTGQFNYKNSGAIASGYFQTTSGHLWLNAPSNAGAAGANATFTTAMTLDTSGYLLIGTTDTAFTSGAGYKFGPGATPSSGQVGASSSNGDLTYRLYSTGAAAYRFYVGFGGTVFATNTTISAISDARLKENVQDIDVGLGAILALKPRKFDWKAGKGKDIKGDRGFIAQEFEQVFPQLVDQWADEAPEGEAPYKSVRQDLIPVLVKAIQELTARVQTLETR